MADSLIYGPVEEETFSGVTGVVEPGGIGNITAFDGATFTTKWLERGRTLAELEQHNGVLSSEIQALKTANSEDFSIRVRYGSYYEAYIVPPADLPSWGFTYVSTNTGADTIALTHQYTPSSTATKIANFYGPVNGEAELANKVYGSVSGQARIAHQGFGHLPVYGWVTFYKDNTFTNTKTVALRSQADVDGLRRSSSGTSWSVDIGGETLTNENIKSVVLTNLVTSLPSLFLSYTTHLDTLDIGSTNITAIGYSFLWHSAFNSPLILPGTLRTIGTSFLSYSSFDQDLALPNSLTSISYAFLANTNQMTGVVNVGSLPATVIDPDNSFATGSPTAPIYATGVTIAGANRSAWLSRLPNSNSNPYRKLVDAGY